MAEHAPPGTGDFEAMARQYWNLWGDALRQAGAASAAPPPAPAWQQALDWWTRLVPGAGAPAGDVVQRFRQQSGDWYGLMQQVAARFAGQDAAAADVAGAWKQLLGLETGGGPLMDFFRGLQGAGSGGFDGWYRQIGPYLDSLRREHERWLHLPAFGPAREHQERWQALARSQQDYQHWLGEYERLMIQVAQRACERFESLLSAHAEPGRQLGSARALFDLWIDAAEQAYAEVALSPEFARVYGELTNAQMRLRLGVQREVEQVCAALGMPTRTEVDSAHRKIAELERRLRQARREDAGSGDRQAPPPRAAAAATAAAAKKSAVESARKSAKKTTKKTAKATAKPARAAAADKAPSARVAPKAAAKRTASRAGKPAPAAAAARKGDAEVVSMKDWVARYAGDEPSAGAGKSKRRRGQGGRR